MSYARSLAGTAAGVPDTVARATPRTARPVAVDSMRELALVRLASMYSRDDKLFVFRQRLRHGGMVAEGRSVRYTAIALIGLAAEPRDISRDILGGSTLEDACERLITDTTPANLGDLALMCWSAAAVRNDHARTVARQLASIAPDTRPCSVVELAWTLSALCAVGPELLGVATQVANRLMRLFEPHAKCFPHEAGHASVWRSHVACFADQIYPVQALSQFFEASGDRLALGTALASARHVCELQGEAGQWWWHYDTREPKLVERYPVYSVHQDGMAPMALHVLQRASGVDFSEPIARGIAWLVSAPELAGESLVDVGRGVIWRKVGRNERRKTSRYLQAAATRVRCGSTWPGLDRLFPPGRIDYECRPYHLGWLLHAWPPQDVTRRDHGEVPS